jgi:hypothetical protein
MGIMSGLLGNASEIDPKKLEAEFAEILIPDEQIERVYKVVRDLFVFTNKRLILVDRQGVTGRKVEHITIPFKSITRFSKENAGTFELDADLKIWVSGESTPIVRKFRDDASVHDIYRLLSVATLR